MDFAEEELKLEHLAVRFKLEETRDEFKKVFEQCQEELKKKPTPQKDAQTPKETEKVNTTLVLVHYFAMTDMFVIVKVNAVSQEPDRF